MDSTNASLATSNGPTGEFSSHQRQALLLHTDSEIETAGRTTYSVEALICQDGTVSTAMASGKVSDMKDEISTSLAGFDVLRFKNNFLEVQYFRKANYSTDT
jgi:hypothetical protein